MSALSEITHRGRAYKVGVRKPLRRTFEAKKLLKGQREAPSVSCIAKMKDGRTHLFAAFICSIPMFKSCFFVGQIPPPHCFRRFGLIRPSARGFAGGA